MPTNPNTPVPNEDIGPTLPPEPDVPDPEDSDEHGEEVQRGGFANPDEFPEGIDA